MLLDSIRQSIDHGLSPGGVSGCSGIATPSRANSRCDLSQPSPAEVVIFKGAVPHRSPHLTLPTAIQERFGLARNLCHSMMDLVCLNVMPTPHAQRPSAYLVGAEA